MEQAQIDEILNNIIPIGFKITNNTNESKIVNLFDENSKYNDNTDVKIEMINPNNLSYDEFISSIKDEEIDLELTRVNSSNIAQLTQCINIHTDNESENQPPLITEAYPAENITQINHLNFPKKFSINKKTSLSFELLPNTTMAIRFYSRNNKSNTISNQQNISIGINAVSIQGINKQELGKLPPSPYQIIIENKTKETRLANLFGFNRNFDKRDSNFGSDEGLEITASQSNVSYSELLAQSALQPFETSLIRIIAKTEKQVKQIITIKSTDANGQSMSVPLITESYWSENQPQKTIIDIPYIMTQNGNTEWFLSILPEEKVSITIFPSEKMDLTGFLGSNYFEKIDKKILALQELNQELGSRLYKLENKKSWWQKLFSKTKKIK